MKMKQFLLNLLMTRNTVANCYALLIYVLIAAKIVMLQYADATESCNIEGVERCIHYSLICLYISIPFFCAFLFVKKATMKSILYLLSCFPFLLADYSLGSAVCCHESYGNVPVELYCLLLPASLTILIIRCNRYMLLFAAYIILVISLIPISALF